MTEYLIDDWIFTAYPGYRRGVVLIKGARNDGEGAQLAAALRREEERLRERMHGANVAEHPAIAAWRGAFKAFGAKPAEHRSSIEALTRRVLKPDALPGINPLVDIGNLMSLRFLMPVGVHPLPSAPALLALRRAREDDRFHPAGGGAPEQIPAQEIVFAQGSEVLTRRWVWRQAAGTQTLPQTRDVFFNLDALDVVPDAVLDEAIEAVKHMALRSTGAAAVQSAVLHAGRPGLVLREDGSESMTGDAT